MTPAEQLAFFEQQLAREETARRQRESESGDQRMRRDCLAYLRTHLPQYRYTGRGVHQCRPETCQPQNVGTVIARRRDFAHALAPARRRLPGADAGGASGADPRWYLCKYGTVHYCNGQTARRDSAERQVYGPPCVMIEFAHHEQRCALTMRSHGYDASGIPPELAPAHLDDTSTLGRAVRNPFAKKSRQHTHTVQGAGQFSGLLHVAPAPTAGPADTPSRLPRAASRSSGSGSGGGGNSGPPALPTSAARTRLKRARSRAQPDADEYPVADGHWSRGPHGETVHRRTTKKRRRFADATLANDMHLTSVSNEVVDTLFYSKKRAAIYQGIKLQMIREMRRARTASSDSKAAKKRQMTAIAKNWDRRMREVAPLGPPNQAFRRYMAHYTALHYRFLMRVEYAQKWAHAFEFRKLCFGILVAMGNGGVMHRGRYLVVPCAYVARHLPKRTHCASLGFRNRMANEVVKHMCAAVEPLEEHEIPFEQFERVFEWEEGVQS